MNSESFKMSEFAQVVLSIFFIQLTFIFWRQSV